MMSGAASGLFFTVVFLVIEAHGGSWFRTPGSLEARGGSRYGSDVPKLVLRPGHVMRP